MKNFLKYALSLCFAFLSQYAYSSERDQACRQGSNMYSKYAVLMDNALLEIYTLNKDNIDNFKNQFKIFRRIFEDKKDKEYIILLEISEKLIRDGEDRNTANAWRVYVENTLDIAYILVVQNGINKELGRSENYYKRMIYDQCIVGIKNK